MLRNKLMKAVAAVAALSLLASAAYAAIPAGNGTISACKDAKGALKVIDVEAGQTCNANQTLLEWGQQGPAGPPGPVGQDGVSGRQVVYGTSTVDSNTKSAVAICPSGKLPIGGGATVGTQSGPSWVTPSGVALTSTYPTSNMWAASAQEVVATDQVWTIVVYAVCATS
jgi:hypothetical protein